MYPHGVCMILDGLIWLSKSFGGMPQKGCGFPFAVHAREPCTPRQTQGTNGLMYVKIEVESDSTIHVSLKKTQHVSTYVHVGVFLITAIPHPSTEQGRCFCFLDYFAVRALGTWIIFSPTPRFACLGHNGTVQRTAPSSALLIS